MAMIRAARAYAESCDRNRDPILAVLRELLHQSKAVLEVGSGTGQHAIYFAEKFPQLLWYTSDREENHHNIQAWLEEAALPNTRGPLLLDVTQQVWPQLTIDTLFSANTTHIMSWREVEHFFAGAGALLPESGRFLLYGPFIYGGRHTSQSNAAFDLRLKGRDPLSGIRDVDALNVLAKQAGLEQVADYEMPSNNRLLHWQKVSCASSSCEAQYCGDSE